MGFLGFGSDEEDNRLWEEEEEGEDGVRVYATPKGGHRRENSVFDVVPDEGERAEMNQKWDKAERAQPAGHAQDVQAGLRLRDGRPGGEKPPPDPAAVMQFLVSSLPSAARKAPAPRRPVLPREAIGGAMPGVVARTANPEGSGLPNARPGAPAGEPAEAPEEPAGAAPAEDAAPAAPEGEEPPEAAGEPEVTPPAPTPETAFIPGAGRLASPDADLGTDTEIHAPPEPEAAPEAEDPVLASGFPEDAPEPSTAAEDPLPAPPLPADDATRQRPDDATRDRIFGRTPAVARGAAGDAPETPAAPGLREWLAANVGPRRDSLAPIAARFLQGATSLRRDSPKADYRLADRLEATEAADAAAPGKAYGQWLDSQVKQSAIDRNKREAAPRAGEDPELLRSRIALNEARAKAALREPQPRSAPSTAASRPMSDDAVAVKKLERLDKLSKIADANTQLLNIIKEGDEIVPGLSTGKFSEADNPGGAELAIGRAGSMGKGLNDLLGNTKANRLASIQSRIAALQGKQDSGLVLNEQEVKRLNNFLSIGIGAPLSEFAWALSVLKRSARDNIRNARTTYGPTDDPAMDKFEVLSTYRRMNPQAVWDDDPMFAEAQGAPADTVRVTTRGGKTVTINRKDLDAAVARGARPADG